MKTQATRYLAIVAWARKRYSRPAISNDSIEHAACASIEHAAWDKYITLKYS